MSILSFRVSFYATSVVPLRCVSADLWIYCYVVIALKCTTTFLTSSLSVALWVSFSVSATHMHTQPTIVLKSILEFPILFSDVIMLPPYDRTALICLCVCVSCPYTYLCWFCGVRPRVYVCVYACVGCGCLFPYVKSIVVFLSLLTRGRSIQSNKLCGTIETTDT